MFARACSTHGQMKLPSIAQRGEGGAGGGSGELRLLSQANRERSVMPQMHLYPCTDFNDEIGIQPL